MSQRLAAVRKHRLAFLLFAALICLSTGCSTVPKGEDRVAFANDARTATSWFENNVYGLEQQIDQSAAYIIYPNVGQWGILIGGGKFGRGMLNRPDDRQIGWAAINTGSVGLQAGVQGFKMLVVFEDEATLNEFMQNRLTGSVSGVATVGEASAASKAPFENGVAVYQGAQTGLMAGINIGLDYMRYEPMVAE
ncbi:MAG: YSC84-related protein [Planctomycetota bacterium]